MNLKQGHKDETVNSSKCKRMRTQWAPCLCRCKVGEQLNERCHFSFCPLFFSLVVLCCTSTWSYLSRISLCFHHLFVEAENTSLQKHQRFPLVCLNACTAVVTCANNLTFFFRLEVSKHGSLPQEQGFSTKARKLWCSGLLDNMGGHREKGGCGQVSVRKHAHKIHNPHRKRPNKQTNTRKRWGLHGLVYTRKDNKTLMRLSRAGRANHSGGETKTGSETHRERTAKDNRKCRLETSNRNTGSKQSETEPCFVLFYSAGFITWVFTVSRFPYSFRVNGTAGTSASPETSNLKRNIFGSKPAHVLSPCLWGKASWPIRPVRFLKMDDDVISSITPPPPPLTT